MGRFRCRFPSPLDVESTKTSLPFMARRSACNGALAVPSGTGSIAPAAIDSSSPSRCSRLPPNRAVRLATLKRPYTLPRCRRPRPIATVHDALCPDVFDDVLGDGLGPLSVRSYVQVAGSGRPSISQDDAGSSRTRPFSTRIRNRHSPVRFMSSLPISSSIPGL